ncbi:hypothetical protein MKX08_005518 [Trichoderma sp. CBMAI-0020]|nr:hypothetical protein MKX08_005518 [Trichoderma sp. CBMAI-0020]
MEVDFERKIHIFLSSRASCKQLAKWKWEANVFKANTSRIVDHNVDASWIDVPGLVDFGLDFSGRRRDIKVEDSCSCVFEMGKPAFGTTASGDDIIAGSPQLAYQELAEATRAAGNKPRQGSHL